MTTTTETAAAQAPVTEFGTELILDLAGCDPLVIGHADALTFWAAELAKKIGMQTYGDPIVQLFGEGSLFGHTVIQLITTSNISVHAVNADNSAFINIFSCGAFDAADAAAWTIQYFKAVASSVRVLTRRVPT